MSTTERTSHPTQSEGSPPPAEPFGGKPARTQPWVYVVIGLLVVGMVAAGLVAFEQNQQADQRQQTLTAALGERNQARASLAALQPRIRKLQAQLAKSNTTSKGEAGQVSSLRKQLAAARKQLTTMVGPALANGKYFGALYAVGATQDAPKLVIDLEQFFTGAAADQAAKQDGALPPGETHVPGDVYIRNDSSQWRILKVDPSAKVTLTTSPFGTVDKPQAVTLGRFGKIWNADKGNITQFPFWITVQNHTVTAIAEQYMP